MMCVELHLESAVEDVGIDVEGLIDNSPICDMLVLLLEVYPQDTQQPNIRSNVIRDDTDGIHCAQLVTAFNDRSLVLLALHVLGFGFQWHGSDFSIQHHTHGVDMLASVRLGDLLKQGHQLFGAIERIGRHGGYHVSRFIIHQVHRDVGVGAMSEGFPCPGTILPRTHFQGGYLQGSYFGEVV
jgi:hypothetical protein